MKNILRMFLFGCSLGLLSAHGAAAETDPHAELRYADYPNNCIECHSEQASAVHQSTHYQWQGEAPDMVNDRFSLQGKLNNAVNSYCVNIKGDWPVCGSCHAGRGKRPDDPSAGLENVDCLMCHNADYAQARKRLADGSMGVENPSDALVQTIHAPTRANCLSCHAKAGGGDGVKRGDLSLALINNSDKFFDYHMNSSGADLACQDCHRFENHRVIGKGSDLRPTDDLERGAELKCDSCHGEDVQDHPKEVARHLPRVACQTCHIPYYAKVPTETHRDWLTHHDGTDASSCTEQNPCPGHPYTEKAAFLIPQYKWWNRTSDNYLLHDDAARTYDAEKQTYPTSRPLGDVTDGKLYPFKYKTAFQPKTIADNRLIALDTYEYLAKSGNIDKSVAQGLVNMGYPADEPYEWVTTDTYQLINHGVGGHDEALDCKDCHEGSERIDLKLGLGYELKGSYTTTCMQCHKYQSPRPFKATHDKHKKYDCSWCHSFSRPERGLEMPGSSLQRASR